MFTLLLLPKKTKQISVHLFLGQIASCKRTYDICTSRVLRQTKKKDGQEPEYLYLHHLNQKVFRDKDYQKCHLTWPNFFVLGTHGAAQWKTSSSWGVNLVEIRKRRRWGWLKESPRWFLLFSFLYHVCVWCTCLLIAQPWGHWLCDGIRLGPI